MIFRDTSFSLDLIQKWASSWLWQKFRFTTLGIPGFMFPQQAWHHPDCGAVFPSRLRPHGFTFTWWGCHGICLTETNRAYPLLFLFFLFCCCVCFCLYAPFNCISFHEFSQQLSVFSLRSYFCLIGPFNCISLHESLLRSWCHSLGLTGLKTPGNN